MATFNGASYLTEQIDSILNQTSDDWTLYINDDGSKDGTENIIQSYSKKHGDKIVIQNLLPKGMGAASNFLSMLENVESEYYMFSDQDDIWYTKKIERCFERIIKIEGDNKGKPVMIHCDLEVVDKNLKVISPSFHKFIKDRPDLFLSFNYLGVINNVCGCTMLFNNNVKKILPKTKNNNIYHDWWIAMFVSKYGIISYIIDSLILYRQHGSNSLGAIKASVFNPFKSVLNFKKAVKHEFEIINNLKEIQYGGFLKYLYYRILFLIKR